MADILYRYRCTACPEKCEDWLVEPKTFWYFMSCDHPPADHPEYNPELKPQNWHCDNRYKPRTREKMCERRLVL